MNSIPKDRPKIVFIADTLKEAPNRNIFQKPRMLCRFFHTEACFRFPPDENISFLKDFENIHCYSSDKHTSDQISQNIVSVVLKPIKKLQSMGYFFWVLSHLMRFKREGGTAVYTPWAVKDLVLGYSARKLGIKWIVDVWDDPEKLLPRTTSPKFLPFKRNVHRRITTYLLSNADILVSKMPEVLTGRYKVPEQKVIKHINGVDRHELEKVMEPRKNDSDESAITLVYTGPVEQNRLMHFHPIAAELNKRGFNLSFRVIGPYYSKKDIDWFQNGCKQYKLHNVIYEGKKPFKDAVNAALNADICICPYPTDHVDIANTYPIKIFEYMALGKAVVMFNLPKMAKILDNNKDAVLIENGDVKAFADAVIRLISDLDFRQRIEETAQRKAREFDWTEITTTIAGKLLESLSKEPA